MTNDLDMRARAMAHLATVPVPNPDGCKGCRLGVGLASDNYGPWFHQGSTTDGEVVMHWPHLAE